MHPAVPVAAALVAATLTACSSSSPPAPTPSPRRLTTVAPEPSLVEHTGSCSLIGRALVQDTLGMRLGRVGVLSGTSLLGGCRFYASQAEPLHSREHLPGPRQPVLEVTLTRYPSAVAAHNAFVRLAGLGTDAQRVTIASGVAGVAYRIRVDPTDGARDWACGFSSGTTSILVRTAQDDSAQEAAALARAVHP